MLEWYKPELNPDVDLHATPRYSKKHVNWTCPNCGDVTESTIAAKVRLKPDGGFYIDGCKKCAYGTSYDTFDGTNDIATAFPEVLEWYKPELNPDVDLNKTPRRSRAIVNWSCPNCGNVTESTVPAKVKIKPDGLYIEGCNACAYGYKRKIISGVNDFATKHPYLEKMWRYAANFIICDPTKISEKSSKKVWWSCEINPKHKFKMRVVDRVMYEHRNKIACPYCKGLRQKYTYYV